MRAMTYTVVGMAWVGLAGCSNGWRPPDNQAVQMSARLQAFESCEAFESYIEDEAVLAMRTSMERSKPSYWKSRGGGIFDNVGSPAPAPTAPAEGGASSAPSSYTGTNNQVAGVDEADFVKNDGTRLFVLSGQKLYAQRSWPAESLRTESALTIEGWPRQMFLHGDKVVVFSLVSTPREDRPHDTGLSDGASGTVCSPGPSWYCGLSGDVSTKVTTVDVSQLAAPQVVGEMYLPGDYHDARLTEGTVRLVLQAPFLWPEDIRWYPEGSYDYRDDTARYERAVDELMDSNEQLIRSRSWRDWLRGGSSKQADGTRVPVSPSCQDYHRTNAPTELGFVTVASLDLEAAPTQAPGLTTLVAQPDIVYANEQSLYISTWHWWWWPQEGQQDYTYVHKFSLAQRGQARYAASGTLEGHLVDQFSLDEHEGVLRVATTLNKRVADPSSPWGRLETSNRVSTFHQVGPRLESLGRTEDLASGESIYSARFLGPRGYVVTFRQVDPLFTFDLSDPAHPRKVGELKVPGFSTYIHPLDDTHLLTVGMNVPENGDWRTRSLKLSLFDVSDMAHPRETFTQLVGTSSSWSEALYDHKAFNFFPARGLLAIPFTDWSSAYSGGNYWSSFVSDLRVFRVDAATGFSPLGSVSMNDMYNSSTYFNWTYWYLPNVRRSVMADDYVYAISDAGVRVSHVNRLSAPLATSRFQPSRVQ